MFILKTLVRVLFLLLLVLTGWVGYKHIPDAYKPWMPIDLNDEINFLTSYKVSRLQEDYALCQNALKAINVDFTPIPDRTAGQCRLENQINLEKSLYPYSAPVRAQCALIAGLVLWEQQVVAKAADTHLNSDISRINHYGIFSCRAVRGSSRRSQHASANAIDISSFTLQSGQTVSVQSHWTKNTAEAEFLKEVRNGACKIFAGVLGPEYNQLHADHFHMDLGRYNICR